MHLNLTHRKEYTSKYKCTLKNNEMNAEMSTIKRKKTMVWAFYFVCVFFILQE